MNQQSKLYRTLWRWHFYAGLVVMPFVLILALTGSIYLFKPQIDRWEERAFQNLPVANPVSPNVQLDAALAAFPGSRFDAYRLPEREGDAPMVRLTLSDGTSEREVFISPQGRVLGSLDPSVRLIEWDRAMHGSLLGGVWGERWVELVGNWAILMVLSGLYLWWPRGRRLAGVVWPRLSLGRRALWRDLHAVTGFWVSGFALILLITALPWAGVWGEAFKFARTELGWIKERPDWKIGAVDHDHGAMIKMQAAGVPMTVLGDIVAKAQQEPLPFPTFVKPPGAPARFGPLQMAWIVKSEAPNRPQNVTISYDAATGEELTRTGFADNHPIDKVISIGIAWHEGQLFGWINQLVGLMTALGLLTLIVSGFIMWRRRKPISPLGAPPPPSVPPKMGGVVAILMLLGVLLPMLGASLILIWLTEHLILPRLPGLARWLGLELDDGGAAPLP
jgi:uncharacterized iron-regulated membrane protein